MRCEWGARGALALAPVSDVVVVVDVFSFTTSVDIATSRGAIVFPYRWRDDSTAAYAASVDAIVAGRNPQGLSLKPSTLEAIESGCRIVLPSPNGSTLSTLTGETPTLAGCLRNARAVAAAASELGGSVAVVAGGELWPDGSLRPCFEDICGAGAIIEHLGSDLSPEAGAARAVYRASRESLNESLAGCASGREKRVRGLTRDIELAAALDTSASAPLLRDGAYRS